MKIPPIIGKIDNGLRLRTHCGEGSYGGAKVFLSTTAGLGGFSFIVEVEPPGKPRVNVVYSIGPEQIKAIAAAVLGKEEK